MGSVGATGEAMSWLPPPRPGPNRDALRPWEPGEVGERLAADGRWEAICYIVIDELHEDVAGLVLSPWPYVDARGRLVFGEEDESRRIAATAEALLAVLREKRLPIVRVPIDHQTEEELRERQLAIGDVFAARINHPPGQPGGGGPAGERREEPSEWLERPVLDVTAQALEAARTQASAAVGGLLDERLIEVIGEEFGEEGGPTTPEPEPEPTPTPGGQSSGGTEAQNEEAVQTEEA